MNNAVWSSSREVSRLVKRCLEEGNSVEIDGLGVFRPDGCGAFEFIADTRPQVFLAYAVENAPAMESLYQALRDSGLEPWMDSRKLLPGQNWPRAIERAIDVSSYFIACLSRRSVSKRGHFQAELRYALQCARRAPLEEIFLIPARLEECAVPPEISQSIHYVDLFPNWKTGVDRIVSAIHHQERQRAKPSGPLAA